MNGAKKWNLEPNEVSGRMQSDWRGSWLVLRCANKNTLPLVMAMEKVGARAWTPLWIRHRRFARSSNSRKVIMPCLPSFVFLAEADASLATCAVNGGGVPGFSLMTSYGVIVRIPDVALEGLRKITDISPRKAMVMIWPATGTKQRIISGAFQGLQCKVLGRSERHCLVALDGGMLGELKITPFLLANVES